MLTMFEITVNLIRSDIRRHSDDGDGRAVLSDVHGGRDTIQLRHDDVHEDHVKVITGNTCDTAISIRSVLLNQWSVWLYSKVWIFRVSHTACSTSHPIDLRNLIPILAQVGSSSTRKILGFRDAQVRAELVDELEFAWVWMLMG